MEAYKMKSFVRIFLTSIVLAGILAACGMPAALTEDPANTINTAVAGTQQAQALAQATVNSSVLTAMPATPTPGPTVEYTTTSVTNTTSDGTVTTEEVAYVYDYYYYAEYYVDSAEDLLNEYYTLYAELADEIITELNSIEGELAQMNDTLT